MDLRVDVVLGTGAPLGDGFLLRLCRNARCAVVDTANLRFRGDGDSEVIRFGPDGSETVALSFTRWSNGEDHVSASWDDVPSPANGDVVLLELTTREGHPLARRHARVTYYSEAAPPVCPPTTCASGDLTDIMVSGEVDAGVDASPASDAGTSDSGGASRCCPIEPPPTEGCFANGGLDRGGCALRCVNTCFEGPRLEDDHGCSVWRHEFGC